MPRSSRLIVLLAAAVAPIALPAASAHAEPAAPAPPAAATAAAPSPRFALEAGGLVSAGLDATDAATRQGGAYVGAAWWIKPRLPLALRYTVASGDVTERLPLPSPAGGSPTLDRSTRQTRQSFDLSIAWRFDLNEGRDVFYLAPSVGPRATWLTDDVSPVWALEGQALLRLGVGAARAWDVHSFVGYGRALAHTSSATSVYGALVAETRFGATASVWAAPALALTLGYEGDVATLDHQSLTYHQLLVGLSRSFD